MQYLRIHMTEEEVIDLDMQDVTTEEALARCINKFVVGRHIGGANCIIPQRSIRWAEVITIEEETS